MQSSQQSPGKMSFEEAHETSKKTSHIDIWERGSQTESPAQANTQNVFLTYGT